MKRRKHADREIWRKLYFELTTPDRLILRSMALTRIQQQAKKQERQMVWVTEVCEPVIIGDQRRPERSKPRIGRRAGDV